MKCIKAIKSTKEIELGEIRRVDDKTAFNMVGSMWAYVSKSEWKSSTRKEKTKEIAPEVVEETTDKKPYKKGQKSQNKKHEKNY